MPELVPVFLKVAGRKVVIVGGGPVAAAKLRPFVEAGALVTVVAPDVVEEIEAAPVAIVRRPFAAGDLDEAWFVVAAAPPDVNRAVAEAAASRRIFVNAVDDRANASAYAGGVFERGGVTVAISTDGRAPALAGLLREALEEVVPDDIGEWVLLGETLRRNWIARGVPLDVRRPLLLEALNRRYQERS